MRLQEVSRVHSIPLKKRKKGRIQSNRQLNPHYIAGFIDGEGSFNISIYRDETMKNKIFIRPEFSIEVRADDRDIIERIRKTINCGKIYNCNYDRYGWYPHVKYKVSRLNDIYFILIPFLEKWPLQAKKAKVFNLFRRIVEKRMRGEHLIAKGVKEITKLRDKMRVFGKKH